MFTNRFAKRVLSLRPARSALALVVASGLTASLVAQPAIAGESGVLFGAVIAQRGTETPAEAVARQDAAYGTPTPMPLSRVFYRNGAEPWPSLAGASGRPVVVSFQYHPAQVVAGQHDDALRTFFAGVPDYDVYWSYFHEPEDNVARGEYTASDYREAWRHVAAIADASAPATAQLHPMLIMMCYTLNPRSGRQWRDYYVPEVHELFGYDCYNHAWRRNDYGAPASFLKPLIDWAKANPDLVWGITEFGSVRVSTDPDGSRRAAWLRDVGAFLVAQHQAAPDTAAQFALYFDTKGPKGTDFRLTDLNSMLAWREVVQLY